MIKLFVLLMIITVNAKMITIRNDSPRFDSNGEIIDAHDGCLMRFNGTYYLYGTWYNNQNGFTPYNGFVCYSSPDLVTWTNHGEILPEHLLTQSSQWGIYYRPHVIYNPKADQYVLYYNWYPWGTGWTGYLGVAVSKTPWGPFKIINSNAATTGDFAAFTDSDSNGYAVFGWHGGNVTKLTDDFLGITGSQVAIGSGEAWGMFKRTNNYYVVGGNLCCFCPQGAASNVYMASTPMGPYKQVSTFSGIQAQHAYVAEILTTTGLQYFYAGDMWQHTPAGYPSLKGYDILYFSSPLEFDTAGIPKALKPFENSWSVDIVEGVASQGPSVPKNIALGKPVIASSSIETGGWSKIGLTDGRKFSQAEYNGWKSDLISGLTDTEWVQVDLGMVKRVAQVELYPKVTTSGLGSCGPFTQDNSREGFPQIFRILVSRDSINWTKAYQADNYLYADWRPQRFDINKDSVRFVRLSVTKANGISAVQLAEMAIYETPYPATAMIQPKEGIIKIATDGNIVIPSNPVNSLTNSDSISKVTAVTNAMWLQVNVSGNGNKQIMQHIINTTGLKRDSVYTTWVTLSAEGSLESGYQVVLSYGDVNLALRKPVTASSSATFTGWSPNNLVDDITTSNGASLGWSSWSSTTTNHTEMVMVDLQNIYRVNQVVLFPRTNTAVGAGFPIDFTIQVTDDSSKGWTTVVTQINYPRSAAGQKFPFNAVDARYIRIVGTTLASVEGSYVMQFAEMQVYGMAFSVQKESLIKNVKPFLSATPNPSNGSVKINMGGLILNKGTYSIYDSNGRLIFSEIVQGCKGLMSRSLNWQGNNAKGEKVPTGTYIGILKTDKGLTFTHSMVLIR